MSSATGPEYKSSIIQTLMDKEQSKSSDRFEANDNNWSPILVLYYLALFYFIYQHKNQLHNQG